MWHVFLYNGHEACICGVLIASAMCACLAAQKSTISFHLAKLQLFCVCVRVRLFGWIFIMGK